MIKTEKFNDTKILFDKFPDDITNEGCCDINVICYQR